MCKFCIPTTKWNPKPNNLGPKCVVCGTSRKHWDDGEFNRWLFLRQAWQKCLVFKQRSTGSAVVDVEIVELWGPPHKEFGVQKCTVTGVSATR